MKDSPINLDSSAKINLNADVKDVIKLMNISDNGVGFVVSDRNKLIGVITDGDLRRGMNRYENINQLNISEIMTPDPVSVTPETPLITAHRLLTKHKITSLPVINGDSFVDADLCQFVAFHESMNSEATILCCAVSNSSRYGTVKIDNKKRILSFREKKSNTSDKVINAGIYLFNQIALDEVSDCLR